MIWRYDWCVIETDNFAGDYPDEKALAWADSKGNTHRCQFTQNEAEMIEKVLNDSRVVGDPHAKRYHRGTLFEHELQPGFEP
jgi:hypothetical protein